MGIGKMNRNKRAILVVSCGCSNVEAREKSLMRIGEEIQAAYPDCQVFHAWTSRMIRHKLLEQEGIWIPGVKEAMEELLAKGFREVVIQPTHVLDGMENRAMEEEIQAVREEFSKIVIGAALLHSEEDKREAARAVAREIWPGSREALVMMGHGSRSGADTVYREMDTCFLEEGYDNIFLGTMEGQLDFESVLRRVLNRKPERILLAPFMVTAGKHAVNDLNGEKENSWKSRFEAAGFPVKCIRKGLGEYEGIRRILVKHAEASMKIIEDISGSEKVVIAFVK